MAGAVKSLVGAEVTHPQFHNLAVGEYKIDAKSSRNWFGLM
jgi:hypothetical protein